jgi:hypothetical protein
VPRRQHRKRCDALSRSASCSNMPAVNMLAEVFSPGAECSQTAPSVRFRHAGDFSADGAAGNA